MSSRALLVASSLLSLVLAGACAMEVDGQDLVPGADAGAAQPDEDTGDPAAADEPPPGDPAEEPVSDAAADLPADDLVEGMSEFDMPESVELAGGRRLKATAANLYKLRHGCYDGGRNLRWDCSSANDGGSLNAPRKRQVATGDTQLADNHGYYWGECVSLVKAMSKNDTVTANWRPGAGVFEGLAAGTAIATFPGGRYSGHTAIFLRYVKRDGRVIGIRVADQNWGARKVRRHVITKGGTGVSNASNYRAVVVP